ncbi:MAG: glycoside hydrolase family 3 C-terminal domain-containing protein, partial [Planctomycetes bacterium]|nr:glycoside hydrolase family 3 C-terminal domain-containing protein [Planctomycetota bacterium]
MNQTTLLRIYAAMACSVSALALLPMGSVTAAKRASRPADYDARARQIVAQMTLDEKIAQLHGTVDRTHGRVVIGLPRLGIPDLTITNGPAGMGPAGPGHEGKATALPAPIALAATWDVKAARTHGEIAADEAALLGNLLLESPDINIARTPHNGRTFESFGEDPVLSGALAVANIHGVQSRRVLANVKHYTANNQETNRFKVNDDIDERTLRELYLPHFEAAVKEGHVDSVMGAYNKVNGAYCCENEYLLDKVLKGDWKFEGFVTSDFGAVHSTVPTAQHGLDVEMPTGIYWGDALKKAVKSGEVPESLLDEKLVRRFRTMMHRGVWDQQPKRGPIPVEKNAASARKLGAEGVVLLKNANGQLPLQAEKIHSIALLGPYARFAMTGGDGSSRVNPIHTVSPGDGLRNAVGKDVTIQEDDGKDVGKAVTAARAADIAILMLGDRQSEGADHPITLAGNQDALAEAVLAA